MGKEDLERNASDTVVDSMPRIGARLWRVVSYLRCWDHGVIF